MGTVKYTGPVASFHCPTNAEIRSLKVHFSPKQGGSGDPSPENVREIVGWDGVDVWRSGKNLFNINVPFQNPDNIKTSFTEKRIFTPNSYCIGASFSNYFNDSYVDSYEISNNILTVNSRQGYSVGFAFALTPGVSYFVSATTKGSSPVVEIANYSQDGTFLQRSTTNYLNKTFIVPENAERTILCFRGSPSGGEVIFSNIQLELGDLATSYEPYQGSTTDYEFGVLGKNKFDKSQCIDGARLMKTDGSNYTSDSANYYISPFIPVTSGATYTKNSPTVDAYHRFATYTSNDVSSFVRVLDNSNTITIQSNEKYIRFCGEITEKDTTQLELGSTATTYEPYDPKHTVYGGWVDLISGEVQEEWYINTIDNISQIISLQYLAEDSVYAGVASDYSFLTEKIGWGGFLDGYCDKLQLITADNWRGKTQINTIRPGYNSNTSIGFRIANNYLNIPQSIINEAIEAYNNGADRTTQLEYASEIKIYLNNYLSGNPIKICYKLATPNAYSLAPIQLQTFLGQNNVWSNADYVEVEYDLHETQTILARKQFIIANQPHIVKPAAATLQNFVTDLAAPLKECKVHFSPVQEGTGDPSPDNVRAITGWTGVEVQKSGKNLIRADDVWGTVKCRPSGGVLIGSSYATLAVPVPKGTIRVHQGHVGGSYINYVCLADKMPEIGDTVYEAASKSGYTNYTVDNSAGHPYLLIHGPTINDPLPPAEWSEANENYVLLGDYETDGYIPTTGTTLPIDWTTEAGTVYGGYVDLKTGEVWKTYYEVNITELGTYRALVINKNNNTQISWFLSNHLNAPEATGYVAYSRDGYCSCAPFYVNNYYWDSKCQVNNSTADLVIEGELTTEEVDNWIKAHAPIQIVYPLKTPQLITTLTPTQLKTLRGTNNIWSNANGNIELSYWKH